jgi:hypothetical protein
VLNSRECVGWELSEFGEGSIGYGAGGQAIRSQPVLRGGNVIFSTCPYSRHVRRSRYSLPDRHSKNGRFLQKVTPCAAC